MKRLINATAAAAIFAGGPVMAGPATDAFSKCLVDSSTGRDRTEFARWVFVAMAAHPDVASMANVTPEAKATASRQAAEVMQRLILVDCRKQGVEAVRQDGPDAVSVSFEVFGRVAASELFANAAVTKEMGGIAAYLDETRWSAFMEEGKKK